MSIQVRKITNRIYEAVDEGVLTWSQVAIAALQYMSEDDVADMARANEFFFLEDDDEWHQDTCDYNDRGSSHHY